MGHLLSFSGTRFAGWYFTCQAVAIVAWWGYLAGVPAGRSLFLPVGASELELLAFGLPDLLVLVPASLSAGLGLASGLTMAVRGAGTPLLFAAPNRLVTSGPYGHVRNPMVIAGLGQGMAVGLWLGSWVVVTYVLLGGAIWQCLVRPAEERDLRDTFGEDFAAYCQSIRCWLPRRRAYKPGEGRGRQGRF